LAFRYLLVDGADDLGSLLRLFGLLALDPLEDLFAVHRYFSGSVDTKADLIAFNTEDRHGHIITDDDRFPNPSGQDQHSKLLLTPPTFRILRTIDSGGRPSVREPLCCRTFKARQTSVARPAVLFIAVLAGPPDRFSPVSAICDAHMVKHF
jgi:hypothetical protein